MQSYQINKIYVKDFTKIKETMIRTLSTNYYTIN